MGNGVGPGVMGGRALLMVTAAAVLFARLSRSTWLTTPVDAGVPDHWIPHSTLGVAFVFGLFAPVLLLPVGALSRAREDGSCLTVPTVLGRRTADLNEVHATHVLVPGRGEGLDLMVLRDRWRVVVVASPGRSSPRWSDAPMLRELWRSTSRQSSRAAARGTGWLVIVVWAISALVLFTIVGVFAGIL